MESFCCLSAILTALKRRKEGHDSKNAAFIDLRQRLYLFQEVCFSSRCDTLNGTPPMVIDVLAHPKLKSYDLLSGPKEKVNSAFSSQHTKGVRVTGGGTCVGLHPHFRPARTVCGGRERGLRQ